MRSGAGRVSFRAPESSSLCPPQGVRQSGALWAGAREACRPRPPVAGSGAAGPRGHTAWAGGPSPPMPGRGLGPGLSCIGQPVRPTLCGSRIFASHRPQDPAPISGDPSPRVTFSRGDRALVPLTPLTLTQSSFFLEISTLFKKRLEDRGNTRPPTLSVISMKSHVAVSLTINTCDRRDRRMRATGRPRMPRCAGPRGRSAALGPGPMRPPGAAGFQALRARARVSAFKHTLETPQTQLNSAALSLQVCAERRQHRGDPRSHRSGRCHPARPGRPPSPAEPRGRRGGGAGSSPSAGPPSGQDPASLGERRAEAVVLGADAMWPVTQTLGAGAGSHARMWELPAVPTPRREAWGTGPAHPGGWISGVQPPDCERANACGLSCLVCTVCQRQTPRTF